MYRKTQTTSRHPSCSPTYPNRLSKPRAEFATEKIIMNENALVQKVWNYAHVLRDQGVPYQAYISQISYLLFLKMDDERAALVSSADAVDARPSGGLPLADICAICRARR